MNDPSWEWPAPPPSTQSLPRLGPGPTVVRLPSGNAHQEDVERVMARVRKILRRSVGKTVTPRLQARLHQRLVAVLGELHQELPSVPVPVSVTMGADGETMTATVSLPAWFFDHSDEDTPPTA